MGHSPGIVQEKTINLRKNNKLHLHFILSLLNVTKMVFKNRHKFEYLHLTYLTRAGGSQVPSVGDHVGGWVIFSPKKQLVHGTNWWVYCPFPKKQLVHGTQLELIILQIFIIIIIIIIVVQFTAIHADRRYNLSYHQLNTPQFTNYNICFEFLHLI